MSEHKHGTTDVKEHEETFQGFIKYLTWSAIVIILILLFLAMVNG